MKIRQLFVAKVARIASQIMTAILSSLLLPQSLLLLLTLLFVIAFAIPVTIIYGSNGNIKTDH